MSQTVLLAVLAAFAGQPAQVQASAACASARDQIAASADRTFDCIGAQVLILMDSGRSDEQIKAEAAGACQAEIQAAKADMLKCDPTLAPTLDDRMDRIDAERTAEYLAFARDRPWEAWTRWSRTACRMDDMSFFGVIQADQGCLDKQLRRPGRARLTAGQGAAMARSHCPDTRAAMRGRLESCFGPGKTPALMPSYDLFVEELAAAASRPDLDQPGGKGKLYDDGILSNLRADYLACAAIRSRAVALDGHEAAIAPTEMLRLCRPDRATLDRATRTAARGLHLTDADVARAMADADDRARAIGAREADAARAGSAGRRPPGS